MKGCIYDKLISPEYYTDGEVRKQKLNGSTSLENSRK
jgi:hypothetical protein